MDFKGFLPISRKEMAARGWNGVDIVFISGDAYVDHPSFAVALLSRLFESRGYKVGIVSQPDWKSTAGILEFGKPRLCAMVCAGNIDSMVNHYTASNKPRSEDEYSTNGKAGHRPDRATIVYSNLARQAFGRETPVIIGGIEASLRRFAHYDFWSDTVRRSILLDSKADLLVYGMGELQCLEILKRIEAGKPLSGIRGTVENVSAKSFDSSLFGAVSPVFLPSYLEVSERDKQSNTPTENGKLAYAKHFQLRMLNENPVKGHILIEPNGDRLILENPPARPLSSDELDELYEFPYMRSAHPALAPVPALREVQFSITSNRGCFGACSFCAITSHQGRMMQLRSKESLLREVRTLVKHPDFKGYIHDIGGPTANFQCRACKNQEENGPCASRQCLFPEPCRNLIEGHSRYMDILEAVRKVQGVKKVFIRSGIRYDYLLKVSDVKIRDKFLRELAANHVSGQLKVAPEHASAEVLDAMGKPEIGLFDEFSRRFAEANTELGLKQYTIPYFIAAHPGSTLDNAVELALYMKRTRFVPDQCQEFYPTPNTVSTCMYYTGLDPRPGRNFAKVYVPKGRERSLQRALLQFNKPENRVLVTEALKKAGKSSLLSTLIPRK